MSAPTGVNATCVVTGGPGTYAISNAWSATGAGSYTVTLYSIIWSVSNQVWTSNVTTASNYIYTNTVTGGSYQLSVTAWSNTNWSGVNTTASTLYATVYNPYGGPQGIQGYQGIGGLQGPTGPTGAQGQRGLQGLMEINNYTVTNQLVTTAADTAHLTANSGLTWNGSTLNIGGNITGVTSINNTTIGGVVITSGALSNATAGTTLTITGQTSAGNIPALTVIPPSGSGTGYTISAGGSNLIGGVTLNNGVITGGSLSTVGTVNGGSTSVHNLGLVTFTNGAITGATTITNSGLHTTGSLSTAGTVTCGAITAPSINNGASTFTITGTTGTTTNTLTVGAPATATCNAIYTIGTIGATSTANTHTIGAVTILNGAITGVTTLNTITIGSTGNVSGMGTLGCGAITTTAGSGITSGHHVPDGDNSRTLGNASTRWSSVHALAVSPGASTLIITGTTGTNSNTLTVGAGNGTGNAIYTTGTIGATSTANTHTIGAVTILNGAIAGASTISNSGLHTTGSLSTAGTVTCGAITAPTVTNTINSLVINAGTCTGVDFVATSDRRLKSDISTISNALGLVKNMRGVYFTRLGQSKRSVGVIAQEVEEVLPEVVHTGDDEMKSVSYGNIVGLLIEANKELTQRLESLEKLMVMK